MDQMCLKLLLISAIILRASSHLDYHVCPYIDKCYFRERDEMICKLRDTMSLNITGGDVKAYSSAPDQVSWISNTSMPRLNRALLREKNYCTEAKKNPELYGSCRSRNSECYNSVDGPGYICNCSKGYRDINERESVKHGDPLNNSGNANFPLRDRLTIGVSASIVSLVVVTLSIIFVYQKRRLQRERDTFLKKNKGIILYEQQLVSRKVEMMKIFTEEELARITNHFATVIGHGGQGKVYKGHLEDYREVAVKKCTLVDDETKKEEFMNELIILSQINHKNVVRLLGCCLEVGVPMLVYEFIANGTLNSFLHENHSPISLETRLRICTESAKALAYLHSETARPILHGDIKPANILLDRNYMAKVSDFGISKFLSIDETQFVTFVRGTFGYLDPEFLQSSRLTAKSDVYSFGIVILELITRKKAVYYNENNERMCLAKLFVSAMRQNDARSIFDQNIATEENLEVLVGISELAEKCLRLSGEERPTMTEVVEQLKGFMAILQPTREPSTEPTVFYTVVSIEPIQYVTAPTSPSGDA